MVVLHFRFVVQRFPIFVMRGWTEGGVGRKVGVAGLSFSNETDAGLFVTGGGRRVEDVGNSLQSLPVLPVVDMVDVVVDGVTVLQGREIAGAGWGDWRVE